MTPIVWGCSVQGAAHIRTGTPCQDCCRYVVLKPGTAVLAVADGHGSESCPSSAVGAALAADLFCEQLTHIYEGFAACPDSLASFLHREGDTGIARAIDRLWKERVRAWHHREVGACEESVYRQYGTTLLGLLICEDLVFALQIGDGDICYVTETGLVRVIDTQRILGVETHSLSSLRAWEGAATALWHVAIRPPCMFTLSSDGYANSYESEAAFQAAVLEYVSSLRRHGAQMVEEAMPTWLTEVSTMGCGDDVTMAFAYFPPPRGG